MSINASGGLSSGEVKNSLEKRIKIAQRFDREKGDAKSTLKEFLGIHNGVDNADNNMEDFSSQTKDTVSTVARTSSVEQSTSSDGVKIKEEEKIAEEDQSDPVIAYQSFGPINFAIVSACSGSPGSQQNPSGAAAPLPKSHASETTTHVDTQSEFNSKIPELLQEQERVSSNASDHSCSLCDQKFTSLYALRDHGRSVHPGEKLFKCDLCDKQFSASASLYVHKIIHTGKKPYKCDVCDKQFARSSALWSHKAVHTKEKSFQCDVCDKKFSSSSTLYVHKIIHTGKKPYKCDVCDTQFASSSALWSHKVVHAEEKSFQCDVCDKKFASSAYLVIHKKTHSKERSFECDVCQKKFTRSQELQKHKRIHTGEKPFKCDVCYKGFSQSSGLRTHRVIHSEEKPFQCDVCNRRFLRPVSLRDHKRLHTGEKPYQCNVCDQKFAQFSGLHYHRKKHSGIKPFQCDICDKKFARSTALRTHKRVHTKQKHSQKNEPQTYQLFGPFNYIILPNHSSSDVAPAALPDKQASTTRVSTRSQSRRKSSQGKNTLDTAERKASEILSTYVPIRPQVTCPLPGGNNSQTITYVNTPAQILTMGIENAAALLNESQTSETTSLANIQNKIFRITAAESAQLLQVQEQKVHKATNVTE